MQAVHSIQPLTYACGLRQRVKLIITPWILTCWENRSHCIIMYHPLVSKQSSNWKESLSMEEFSTFIPLTKTKGLNNGMSLLDPQLLFCSYVVYILQFTNGRSKDQHDRATWWETPGPRPHLVVILHRGTDTWTRDPCRLAKCLTFQVKMKCQGRFLIEMLSPAKDSRDCWDVQTLAERYDSMSLNSHYL